MDFTKRKPFQILAFGLVSENSQDGVLSVVRPPFLPKTILDTDSSVIVHNSTVLDITTLLIVVTILCSVEEIPKPLPISS